MLRVWIASSREAQINFQIVSRQWGPYANGYSPLVRSAPQGDGTARLMAQGKKKKGEKNTHTYINLCQIFILAWGSIVTAHSLLSQLKSTKCELRCLHSADKLAHKLHSETFTIWCKRSTLGDTLIISNDFLCISAFLWGNTAKMSSLTLFICKI